MDTIFLNMMVTEMFQDGSNTVPTNTRLRIIIIGRSIKTEIFHCTILVKYTK